MKMIETTSGLKIPRQIFRRLEERGRCVILHHFDFEEGGDIDFCGNFSDLGGFIALLKGVLDAEGWRILQVLEHEQAGAYIVCGDCEDLGRFLLLDYCYDYRVRGHLVLSNADIQESPRNLSWGGKGAEGWIEFAYRFSKAAAKRKNAAKTTIELQDLWDQNEIRFRAWMRTRWDLDMREWNQTTVSSVLAQLELRMKKPILSVQEIALKIKRLRQPRGLWLECPEDIKSALGREVASCFRKVSMECSSVKWVLGSTLVVVGTGSTPWWKRRFLKLVNCWLEASSRGEVLEFLARRNEIDWR